MDRHPHRVTTKPIKHTPSVAWREGDVCVWIPPRFGNDDTPRPFHFHDGHRATSSAGSAKLSAAGDDELAATWQAVRTPQQHAKFHARALQLRLQAMVTAAVAQCSRLRPRKMIGYRPRPLVPTVAQPLGDKHRGEWRRYTRERKRRRQLARQHITVLDPTVPAHDDNAWRQLTVPPPQPGPLGHDAVPMPWSSSLDQWRGEHAPEYDHEYEIYEREHEIHQHDEPASEDEGPLSCEGSTCCMTTPTTIRAQRKTNLKLKAKVDKARRRERKGRHPNGKPAAAAVIVPGVCARSSRKRTTRAAEVATVDDVRWAWNKTSARFNLNAEDTWGNAEERARQHRALRQAQRGLNPQKPRTTRKSRRRLLQ